MWAGKSTRKEARMTTSKEVPEGCDMGEHAGPTWWEHDAQGIPLAKVCDRCVEAKLSKYRPEILTGYTQDDVQEPIEPEEP
jgi:hypothetical protein